jgi:cell division protein FtsL
MAASGYAPTYIPALRRSRPIWHWALPQSDVASILLLFVLLALVASMYLYLAGEIAALNRTIARLEQEKTELIGQNAALRAQIASLSSPQRIEQRALSLGMRPIPVEFVRLRPLAEAMPGQSMTVGSAPARQP